MSLLNVSIVTFNHPFSFIEKLVIQILSTNCIANMYISDNSFLRSQDFSTLLEFSAKYSDTNKLSYIFNNKNLGYGAGHNVAIRKSIENNIDYHLVLNPDIELKAVDIDKMVKYMDENPNIGHLMPKVLNPDGSLQYLCKQLPSPFDLIIRRFFPKKWFTKRRDWFEMRDSGYDKIMDVPYLSGSIMLLRVNALKEVGLFDERFFMYPEDIDLTRRIGAKYRTIFYPEVSVIHHHEKASFKSIKMLWIHAWNITKYFAKWGLKT